MSQEAGTRLVLISPDELEKLVSTTVHRAVSAALQGTSTKTVMTEAEAADYLGFAQNTLRQWRVEGIGPRYSKPAGTAVRYLKESLDAWLAAGQTVTASHHLRG
ncbi:helix-turn-helix transcriptional regulator [Desulfovibrio piger]|uniref:helix-turn-helix transcriptional regulator n=1 Tax=Desulfovibrio piger TaxID=901 RepID=UPI00266680E3|nr:helix-turn-helix domain-containing protein [Desulfovibrio piger]